VRARRAARIAALKIGWGIASVVLLSSTLVEYTQPDPSPFTPVFVVVWIGVSAWTYRAIRRARA
jgi:CHASE2 domain-containing sensor protein